MAKRVITWPEHKKLLQKRHGAVAEPEPKQHIAPMSYNKVFYCGALAVEMALEIVPNPRASKLLRRLLLAKNNDEMDAVTEDLHEARREEGVVENLYYALHSLALLTYQPYGRVRGMWEDRVTGVIYNTASYVFGNWNPPDDIPPGEWGTYYHQQNQFIAEWREEVERRCAQRLAFTRPGSSDIEMQPPPLLEY